MKHPLFAYCLPALAAGSLTCSPAFAAAPLVEQVQALSIQLSPVGQPLNPGDGFFYGAAGWADHARGGVIYRFAPGQDAEVLYTFSSVLAGGVPNAGGSNPLIPMIIGPDGAFYGATRHGGANAYGTIYRFSQDGVFSVLHHLDPATEGAEINCLISTPEGDLFGQTGYGGPLGGGTLFRLSLGGVYQTVYSFATPPSPMDPDHPAVLPPSDPSHLAVGSDGKIYGVSRTGGPAEITYYSDRPVDDPIKPFLKIRRCYGSFFRYDGPNAITELSNFDPIKEHCGPLVPVADGFYSSTGTKLLHIALGGTVTLKTDFHETVGGRLTLPPPIVVEDKVFGVSYHSGANDAGFIYRYTPGGQTENIYDFAAEFAERRKWLVAGNDGMIYGLAALPQGGGAKPAFKPNSPELPLTFRYRETPGAANFMPAARPDVAWLPAKATKDGTREILIDVLGNDADADKDPLVTESVETTGESSGSATIVSTPNGQRIRVTTTAADPESCLFSYRVNDGKGGTAITNLAVKAPLTGNFKGTISGDPVTLKFGKKNSVSATVLIDGKKFTGAGTLDVDDSADLTLKAKGQPALSLHLGVTRDGSRKVLTTLVDGDSTAQGTCTAASKK